jgi:deoxyadenosine/deoxycytidine kinase
MAIRVEICGPIGAGKSTLAKAFEQQPVANLRVITEDCTKVPFWSTCWRRPGKFEFERDVAFLLYHGDLVAEQEAVGGAFLVDFAIFEDLAYATVSNSGADLADFRAIYARVRSKLPPPDLVVSLTCPVAALSARIAARARPQEAKVSAEFLTHVSEAISHELDELRRETGVPVLAIDAGSDCGSLDERIRMMRSQVAVEIERLL